jgi:hypothetical protein
VCGVVSKKRWYACWAHVPKSVGSIPTANRFDFCIFYMLFAQIYFYLRVCKLVRVGSNTTADKFRP